MDFVATGIHTFALIVAFLSIVLFLAALIHLITNKSKDPTSKIFWLIIILMLPVLGPILYFVLGRQ